MGKFIEYLLDKKKMEICVGIVIIIFLPTYLIDFIYYPDWFNTIEFIKMTVVNAAALICSYVIQMIIFFAVHMITKKKREQVKKYSIHRYRCLGSVCI